MEDINKICQEIELTQLSKWCMLCIKEVTGDDLTGYNEDQLDDYFGIEQPIMNIKDYPNITLSFNGRYFTYLGSATYIGE